MKLDKPNGPRPGVALATVAAAFTVAIGITIGALASYTSSSEGSNDESTPAAEAEAPVADDAAVMEAQPSPAAQGAEVRGAKRHDKGGRKHERREHDRDEDDDDDD